MIKKLLPFARQYRLQAILSPLLILIEVILDVMIPFQMAKIVDVGIPNADLTYILKIGGMMLLMALGALAAGAGCARVAAVAASGFAKNLSTGLFSRIQSFAFKNTDKFSTPSLITRLTNDVTNVRDAFMMCIRMLARSPLMLILATVMAVRISPSLSVIMLLAIPVLGGFMFLVSRLAFPRFQSMLSKLDSMNARTQENLIAIRVVKAFVRGDYETEKFEDSAHALKLAQFRAEKLLILTMPVMQIVMYVCIISVLWFGSVDILEGSLLTGELISFISYISQILMSLMMITAVFINLVLSSASAKRITEVLDEVPAIADDAAKKDLSVPDGSIRFEDVCFSYADDPDNLTLSHIDLSIASGETIGVIGGSGSGKTTLVQLIPRLYDTLSGRVLVGGHDVKDYTVEHLRQSIGMVLQ